MKRPPKIKKTTRVTGTRKLKQEIKSVVHDCLIDIEWYIVTDLMRYLKKRKLI